MRKAFRNASQVEVIFTDEGITFYGAQQEVFLPYGCINEIRMSLLGIVQATSGKRICSFAADRKDRAEMKEMVRFARKAMETAPKAEAQVIDRTAAHRVSTELPVEEQLRQYKNLFIQGAISKEEYDLEKRRLKEI